MFSVVEQKAIRIILDEKPENLGDLASQLFPDMNSAPSRDMRVRKLKETLRQRIRANESSAYFHFYRKKRRGEGFASEGFLSSEDLAFLEEIHRQCPSWIAFRGKILEVLRGQRGKVIPPKTK